MEFKLGILIGISIMLVLFLCVWLGYKLGHRPVKEVKTEEQLLELQRREDGIANIMGYDYSKALGKR